MLATTWEESSSEAADVPVGCTSTASSFGCASTSGWECASTAAWIWIGAATTTGLAAAVACAAAALASAALAAILAASAAGAGGEVPGAGGFGTLRPAPPGGTIFGGIGGNEEDEEESWLCRFIASRSSSAWCLAASSSDILKFHMRGRLDEAAGAEEEAAAPAMSGDARSDGASKASVSSRCVR